MKTLHKADCSRVWRRYDASCPRCQELISGAAPRAGWSDFRKAAEASRIAEIRAHDCRKSGCGPICTFGDW